MADLASIPSRVDERSSMIKRQRPDSISMQNQQLISCPVDIIFEVVWYSWSSNWGADFYGGVRISLPDPASTSVVQGYWHYPNGTLAVDYPDVVLLKLLSRKLFPKAPEAYWMLRNFKIEPRELFELLGTTGTSGEAERIAAACQWLKTKRSRHLARQIGLVFSEQSLVACCFGADTQYVCVFTRSGSESAVRYFLCDQL